MNTLKDVLDVVFIIYENTLSTSISLPMELLNSANHIARVMRKKDSSKNVPPKLRIKIASIDGKSKTSQTGSVIKADNVLEEIKQADIIFMPAMWRNPVPVLKKNKAICLWLKKAFKTSDALFAGVGTGCYFLAEAGLLENRVATTHWYFFEDFEQRYTNIKLQRNYFITQTDRLYCTGSVNALADLTVHFISQYWGESTSREVERHFFHDVRQNYQKLALQDKQSRVQSDESMMHAISYIENNYHTFNNTTVLANIIGMSRRNLDRRFKEATGLSILSYIQKLRIEAAQDLLKNSNLSITEIIYEVGYQDPAYFSRLFKSYKGVTPRQYRFTVRSKLFEIDIK